MRRLLTLAGGAGDEKHPEKRLKAAYKAYGEIVRVYVCKRDYDVYLSYSCITLTKLLFTRHPHFRQQRSACWWS